MTKSDFTTLLSEIPVRQTEHEEKPYIDLNQEYFAVTPIEFLVYSKEKKCWYCLRTRIIIEGNISDIIDEKGNMYLYVKDKPITKGKWGTADSIDTILDFYNSGRYIQWLNLLM